METTDNALPTDDDKAAISAVLVQIGKPKLTAHITDSIERYCAGIVSSNEINQRNREVLGALIERIPDTDLTRYVNEAWFTPEDQEGEPYEHGEPKLPDNLSDLSNADFFLVMASDLEFRSLAWTQEAFCTELVERKLLSEEGVRCDDFDQQIAHLSEEHRKNVNDFIEQL